ncbi:hypothetical protein RRSWK_03559 [Rhodopirellula sp. SWK7]|nr:hypothetical protein RRSWK_03559 [Rhodopirellula sp. SWK7]
MTGVLSDCEAWDTGGSQTRVFAEYRTGPTPLREGSQHSLLASAHRR